MSTCVLVTAVETPLKQFQEMWMKHQYHALCTTEDEPVSPIVGGNPNFIYFRQCTEFEISTKLGKMF